MASSRQTNLPPMGAHMSIAGGVSRAVARAEAIGADTFQIFLKNNTQWQGKAIDPTEAEAFRVALAAGGFDPPLAHSSYLINLASPSEPTATRSTEAMADELVRARQLSLPGVVVHPGAHVGEGDAHGLALIGDRINRLFASDPANPVAIYLETTAGMGTTLGWRFEQLAELIGGIEDAGRIGVCLDTCHVFAAGYDLRTATAVAETLLEFDRIIGLKWLRAIHTNDSKTPLGSRRDRHEHIGKGEIGKAGFAALLRDARLRHLPFILETPKRPDSDDDRRNLATLRRLARSPRKGPT